MTNAGSVAQIVSAVRSGAASAADAVERALAAAAACELNAFITLDPDGARAAARGIDARRAAGAPLGPLAGVPIGLKDIFSTRGLRTTCASRMLADYVPPFDATVVERLRAADAIFIGKLNMDEFAMGSSNENSAYGPVRNPWDPSRVTGGSSGGSAAAVAARLCPVALGTDTGGSIRQPAALCGVVGLKPSYGRVSRFGLVAFASSLDQAGPIGATVRDVAAVYAVMAGPDPRDATTAERPVEPLGSARPIAGLRVGVPHEYMAAEGLQPAVRERVEAALEVLRGLGAKTVPIHLPSTGEAVAAYYVVATAEASSNLARFDGVRFGHRAPAADLAGMYTQSRRAFGPEVRRRLMLGTFVLSAGYYDAYYGKALAARRRITADFTAALADVDMIATPTSPTTAFPLGERTADPLAMYLADVFTVPASLAGLPALSVPCGFDEAGRPVGLQLIGRAFDEAGLLSVAAAYEDATGWPTTPEAA